MNRKCGVEALIDACHRNDLNSTLEKYIESCRDTEKDGEEPKKKAAAKRGAGKFPNVAGFCRYYGIGIGELEKIYGHFPDEIEQMYAIFEDEALNSDLPPAVLSAYLKKRLGYDKDTSRSIGESGQLNIRFEHDIYDDGE